MKDKFEVLMRTFAAWSKTCQYIHNDKPRVMFFPDGSGVLERRVCSTVIEFDDVDEVIAYMERRIKTAGDKLEEESY